MSVLVFCAGSQLEFVMSTVLDYHQVNKVEVKYVLEVQINSCTN